MALVLVVEDEDDVRDLVRVNLERDGHRVAEAADGAAALEMLEGADVVVLDLRLPEIDGMSVLRHIQEAVPDIPVIVLTARATIDDKVRGLDAGAFDYVTKPFEPAELLARVRAALRVKDAQEVMLELMEKLRREAILDPLTGLLNRRALDFRIEEECGRLARNLGPSSVLMVDIDGFKDINDSHGHPAGDEVVREVAKTLVATCRRSDVVFRYGGDEFFVLLAGAGLDGASIVAHRACEAIRRSPLLPNRVVTASIGVTEGRPQDTPAVLVGRADRALYTAKQQGRDCVVSIPESSLASSFFR